MSTRLETPKAESNTREMDVLASGRAFVVFVALVNDTRVDTRRERCRADETLAYSELQGSATK